MSRTPTFAGVGRLGLPLVAAATGVALWSTSWAMATSVPGSAVVVAMPQQSQPTPGGGAAQVGVSIPSVVFGPADGLSARVGAGAHHAVVAVWLAAGSPAAVASVTSSTGRVRGCTAVHLRPAAVTQLHCTVEVARGSSFALTVATSVAGQHFRATYRHRSS